MANSVNLKIQKMTEDLKPLSLPSALAFKHMLLTWAMQRNRKSPI